MKRLDYCPFQILQVVTFVPLLGFFIGCHPATKSVETVDAVNTSLSSDSLSIDSILTKLENQDQPWILGEVARPRPRTIWLTSTIGKKVSIRHPVLSDRAEFAIATFERNRGDYRAIAIDLRQERVLASWPIDKSVRPFAISPRGNVFVFRGGNFEKMTDDTLVFYRVRDDGAVTRRTWAPLTGSNVDGQTWRIGSSSSFRWIDFVTPDILATVCTGGRLHLWQISDNHCIATIPDVIGFPTICPDGDSIVVATELGILLVKGRDGTPIGFHAIDQMPKNPTVSVQPDGCSIGIIGSESVTVVDPKTLRHRRYETTRLGQGSIFMPMPTGWVGRYLMVDNRLIDIESGLNAVDLTKAKACVAARDAVWACVHDRARKRTAFQCFPVDDSRIAERVNRVLRDDKVAPWRVGGSAVIDVSALPSKDQATVRRQLQDLLRSGGFREATAGEMTLKASIGPPGKIKTATYTSNNKQKQVIKYRNQPAMLELIWRGETIWSARKSHYASPFMSGTEESIKARQSKIGKPNFWIYTQPLPRFAGKKSLNALIDTPLLAH